jgi:hypothetical protein
LNHYLATFNDISRHKSCVPAVSAHRIRDVIVPDNPDGIVYQEEPSCGPIVIGH